MINNKHLYDPQSNHFFVNNAINIQQHPRLILLHLNNLKGKK